MSLADIFKRKPERKAGAKKEEKEEKTKPEPKSQKDAETIVKKQRDDKAAGETGWILRYPQISEKAGYLAEKNQYVFRVSSRANKTDIKKAVEGIFEVTVSSVKIINIPKKERKVGRTIGFKKGYKKAIVKIREGQKIEVLPR